VTKPACHVASIALTWVKVTNASGYAQGVVTITDNAGKPVSGALVSVKSTGLVAGTGQGRTDSRGQLVLVTTRLPATTKGDLTFAVTAVSHPTLVYDSTKNVVTSTTLTLAGATAVVQPLSYRPHGDRDDDDHR
jgi:hypothetical protein